MLVRLSFEFGARLATGAICILVRSSHSQGWAESLDHDSHMHQVPFQMRAGCGSM